jgi:hypothetical protein
MILRPAAGLQRAASMRLHHSNNQVPGRTETRAPKATLALERGLQPASPHQWLGTLKRHECRAP